MIQTCVVDFYTSSHWLLVSQQKVTFLFPRILDLFSKTWRKMLGVFLTLCVLLFHGASGVEMDKVSVMEGDSVTLNTDVTKNRQERIMWYFNEDRIAYITGDQTKICTDPECPETFRGRLKLDTQTGSLTITNINTTDSGVYHLQINSRNREKTFNVTVHDAPAPGRDEMKSVQEGESVTLDPGSDLSSATVAGISVAVVIILLAAAAGVIYYLKKYKGSRAEQNQVQVDFKRVT